MLQTVQEVSHGCKMKKGKEAEALVDSCHGMIRRAKDTAHGFDLQPFNFGKAQQEADAELESPEKSGGLGWDASSEARFDGDLASLAGDQAAASRTGGAEEDDSGKGKGKGKTRTRDVGRFRVSSFEKQRKIVTNIEQEGKNALKSSQEALLENDGRKDQFSHFFEIVTVRQSLLQAILDKSQDDFKAHVEGMDSKCLSFQPVPKDILMKTWVLQGLKESLETIMQKTTKSEIELLCSGMSDQAAIHIQLRNSLKNSTRDLDNAIKADARKKEREVEAAAKKAAKKKQTADGAAAAATRKAAAAAAKDCERGVTILSTYSDKLKFSWFPRFPDVSKFKARLEEALDAANANQAALQLVADVGGGSVPFVISNMPEIAKLVQESPSLRCMVTNFGHQFPGTQLCRASGRAQCPAKMDEPGGQLLKMMMEAAPFRKDSAVLDEPGYKDLAPILQMALFGFTPEMSYVGFEERGIGQLRYVLQGSRRVITASPRAIQDRFNAGGDAASSVSDMINIWKFIDLAKLTDCSYMFAGVQKAGSLMYIPPGWLVAEEVVNGEKLVGFRVGVLPKHTDACVRDFNAFLKLIPQGHAYQKLATLAHKCIAQQAAAA